MSSLLCFSGLALFVTGLVTGFAIPRFRSPRIGLSAHLAGVQCGTALIVFGFLWPHLSFWSGWAAPLAQATWISFCLIWLGLVLGAAWGTGRSLPIAGAGHQALPWQERTALSVIGIGSFGSLVALVLVLVQWHWVA